MDEQTCAAFKSDGKVCHEAFAWSTVYQDLPTPPPTHSPACKMDYVTDTNVYWLNQN